MKELVSWCCSVLPADGILSYRMPQGDRRGPELDLADLAYDGKLSTDGRLSDGLGQLVDGVEGASNFRFVDGADGRGRKGYDWIGWRNDTSAVDGGSSGGGSGGGGGGRTSIQIVFEFDAPRRFTSARLHANNLFSKEVRVFRRATFRFTAENPAVGAVVAGGGGGAGTPTIVYDVARDSLAESARYVVVSLRNRIGRFVAVELFFDARWMMISEVRFESGRRAIVVRSDTLSYRSIIVVSRKTTKSKPVSLLGC